MKNQKLRFLLPLICIVFLYNCSKKTNPTKNNTAIINTKPISTDDYKKEQAKKGSTNLPKVIVVNDSNAKKTSTGKYYYDLNGYRYWKNNKDGKYYLNGIFLKNK
ncbi:MAG: hypothetical protein JSU03_09515 [Bacteroidetes bacterium]|nr:hypothetical protein [Bacteroidota bacterium]MBS1757503.1 hypothetical protein [Bacteroidota bacterium]